MPTLPDDIKQALMQCYGDDKTFANAHIKQMPHLLKALQYTVTARKADERIGYGVEVELYEALFGVDYKYVPGYLWATSQRLLFVGVVQKGKRHIMPHIKDLPYAQLAAINWHDAAIFKKPKISLLTHDGLRRAFWVEPANKQPHVFIDGVRDLKRKSGG